MSFIKKGFTDIYETLSADTRRRVPELSDFEEGSVIRSLLESFAVEMATLYEQMDLVYQAGFVDTAEGPNLDRVVAVLGIKRNEPDFATGSVTFDREPGQDAELVIPIGTLITTEEDESKTPSKKAYLTIEEGRLNPGDVAVDVRVRAEERGKQMSTESETVIVMPRPVPGVKSVTNKRPISFLGRERETDEELRERAKKILLASGRASITAIENALLGMPGVRAVRIREDFYQTDANLIDTRPGVIEVFVDGYTSQNARALQKRVDEVRAAGIFVSLKPAIAISLEAALRVELDGRVSAEEQPELEKQIRDAVVSFIERVSMGDPLLFSQLTSEVLKISGVNDLAHFELTTYREMDSFAEGTVILKRTANLAENVQIRARTPLTTTAGQEFLTTVDVQADENQAEVTAPVQAILAGRVGELVRTGSAVTWNDLTLGEIAFAVRNEAPVLLARTVYTPGTARRIETSLMERFIPESVRVAASEKPLRVHVQVKLATPGEERDDKRARIEETVSAFFNPLTAGQSFLKTDLATAIQALNVGAFDLRLLAFPFQSETPRDDYETKASFFEKAQPDVIFVYSDRLELTGSLALVLPLTATDEERVRAVGGVRQAIVDFLEDLHPEEDVALDRIEAIAQAGDRVLRVVFKPEKCNLLDLAGNELPDRLQGTALKVSAFEKVFLSKEKFVISA